MDPNSSVASLPDYVVCPRCHGPLVLTGSDVVCTSCAACYPFRSTAYFAPALDDAEKMRQQAIYDGAVPGELPGLSYRDLQTYRDFCTVITALIRQQGLNGYQFKALKTREVLDRINPQPGERVLDVGCGDGSMLALLTLRYGTRGTGVDISSLVVDRSVQVNPWGHEYYQADAELLPFEDSAFDGVVSMDVLEHLPHPQRCIAEAARVLRPGGWALFYAVSQRDTYTWHWMQRQLTDGRVGVDCGAGHRWENFLQPDRARLWMNEAGFTQVRLMPFHALATLILDERFAAFFVGLVKHQWLLRIILKITELADQPLTSRGFGNGFYLKGYKSA